MRLSSRQVQELKILNDIQKLLISMELLKTRRNVLASDDLYPHDSESDSRKQFIGSQKATRTAPSRTQSLHCRPAPTHLRGTASAVRSERASSGSPSNFSKYRLHVFLFQNEALCWGILSD